MFLTAVSGHYKVEVFDFNANTYVPAPPGLGFHVNVADPTGKIQLSRVRSTDNCMTIGVGIMGRKYLFDFKFMCLPQ